MHQIDANVELMVQNIEAATLFFAASSAEQQPCLKTVCLLVGWFNIFLVFGPD